jgi:hypothetical protein
VVSKGLPKELIDLLPRRAVEEKVEEKCMVCIGEFEKGECVTTVPGCSHLFHFECLEVWLGKEKVCPLCKQELQFERK